MNDIANAPQETAPAKSGGAAARPARVYRPLADIVETEEGVTLMMEMPGVAAEDVEIELDRRVLTVTGRAGRTTPNDFRLAYAEYGEGDYERAFTLSEDLDPAGIEAEMKNGVLTLKLPRAEEARPQRIAVKAG